MRGRFSLNQPAPARSKRTARRVVAQGGRRDTLVRVPKNGHGGPGFTTPENWKRIEDFFDKHLK